MFTGCTPPIMHSVRCIIHEGQLDEARVASGFVESVRTLKPIDSLRLFL